MFCLIIFLLIGHIIYATPQSHDVLLHNGEYYSLLNYPLEEYFMDYPEKRPEGGVASAQWRGYSAFFAINQNKLYAISINVGGINVIKECLGEPPDVYLNWWNGILRLIDGDIIDWELYGLVKYEYYKLIEIINGDVINEYRLNSDQYEKYSDIIYELYKKENEEYLQSLEKDFVFKEYSEIFDELNDGLLPKGLVNFIINEYELKEKINIKTNSSNINEINVSSENESGKNNKLKILIGGILFIGMGIFIYFRIKKHNIA